MQEATNQSKHPACKFRRSRARNSCKTLQCDTGKPTCRNCEKRGIVCQGYPQKKPLEFRDETATTEYKSKKTYEALERALREKSGTSPDESSSNDASSGGSGNTARSAVARRLAASDRDVQLDLQDVSFIKDFLIEGTVCAFLESWPSRPVALVEGNIEHASNLYPECIDCLKCAVEAMSLWSLSVSRHGEDIDIFNAAIKCYWKTVNKISKAVEAYDESKLTDFEQILLAIELISIFDILSKLPGVVERVQMHWRMMCALIIKRGEAMFRTETRRRLFLDCFMGIIMARVVLDRPNPMPLPTETIECLLRSPLTPRIPEYTILPLIQRSFDLKRDAATILDDIQTPDLSAAMWLKQMTETALNDLVVWYTNLEANRKGRQGAGSLTVNICRVHQIFLHDIRTRCCDKIRMEEQQALELNEEIRESIDRVQEVVEEIKQSMPYQFDESSESVVPLRPTSPTSKKLTEHLTYS